jgi:hypothetical protein
VPGHPTGPKKVRKLEMINCQITQLKTIMRKPCNQNYPFDYWKDDTITSLMQELDAEYHHNQENQRLYDEYSQYSNILKDISEKEQRIDTMFKLDISFTEMLCKTERFYYLAGLNHAMRIIKNCCSCPESDICDCGFIHIGIKRNQKSKMINYSLYQLETFILMKYVESPEDNIEEYINQRLEKLYEEHNKIQSYQKINNKFFELMNRIETVDNKEQRSKLLDEFKKLIFERMCETEKYHYLTGFNDVIRVFEIDFNGAVLHRNRFSAL